MNIDVPDINNTIDNVNRAKVEAINLILMSPYTEQETRNNLCIYLHERNVMQCDKETVGASLKSTVLKYCGSNDVLIIYNNNYGYYKSCKIDKSNKFDVYSCKDNIDHNIIKMFIRSESKKLGTIYLCNNPITGNNLIFNNYHLHSISDDSINIIKTNNNLWYVPFFAFLTILGFVLLFLGVGYFIKSQPQVTRR